jgi:hypothetical protein
MMGVIGVPTVLFVALGLYAAGVWDYVYWAVRAIVE